MVACEHIGCVNSTFSRSQIPFHTKFLLKLNSCILGSGVDNFSQNTTFHNCHLTGRFKSDFFLKSCGNQRLDHFPEFLSLTANMFSKLFNGQNEETLQALELQWRTEYAKAQRKFRKQKEVQKKGGRPKLGQLQLNLLDIAKKMDLTSIARNVATTREGRRNHQHAAKCVEKRKSSSSKKQVNLFTFYIFFACLMLAF